MFFIVGIFMAIFLALLLLIKKNKSRADQILIGWLFLIAIHQLLFYFTNSGELFNYPHWLGVEFPLPILHGVLLFFYTLEVTGNSLKNKWLILLHLVPALSLILFAIPFYKLTGDEKIFIFKKEGLGYEWYLLFSSILISLSGSAYSVCALILIKKHQVKIQNRFSNTDKKELLWLRSLSIGYAVIWVLAIFFEGFIIFSAVVILVLFMGVFGINQLNIFNQNIVSIEKKTLKKEKLYKSNKPNTEVNKKEKYAKSGLTEEKASEIYKNLNALMEDSSNFINEDLTLVELSKKLHIHPNHLSQVINEKENKNFYNYINALRIKEFIKFVSQPENKKYTMISLAYDCGFNSKSTFNKHFKLNTGKTPTEFFNS